MEIKELLATGSHSRWLVRTSTDLMELVQFTLGKYEKYLHGDCPAVVDLWDKEASQPVDEEDFSDHLMRYMALDLKGVIINREVTIRRKQFKEGKPGSRTDLWIQVIDERQKVLTLCIEVKCNWNSSAKTAIKDQLVEKYMSGGTAEAGILLLAWFESPNWAQNDGRSAQSKLVWPTKSMAWEDLRKQAAQFSNCGKPVASFVVNCEAQ